MHIISLIFLRPFLTFQRQLLLGFYLSFLCKYLESCSGGANWVTTLETASDPSCYRQGTACGTTNHARGPVFLAAHVCVCVCVWCVCVCVYGVCVCVWLTSQ